LRQSEGRREEEREGERIEGVITRRGRVRGVKEKRGSGRELDEERRWA